MLNPFPGKTGGREPLQEIPDPAPDRGGEGNEEESNTPHYKGKTIDEVIQPLGIDQKSGKNTCSKPE